MDCLISLLPLPSPTPPAAAALQHFHGVLFPTNRMPKKAKKIFVVFAKGLKAAKKSVYSSALSF
jgi:hypothetical protein